MLKGIQERTGTVHFAEESKVRGRTYLLPLCGSNAAIHFALAPIPSDTPVTCGRCVKRPAATPTQPKPDQEDSAMTVTVQKGAGRPAAAAKRTKAAQRTPLPPKGSIKEPAEVEATTRSRRKATTGSEEAPNPTRPVRKSASRQAAEDAVRGLETPKRPARRETQEEQRERVRVTRESATRARKAAAKRPEAKQEPMPTRSRGTRKASAKQTGTGLSALADDFPGAKKIRRLEETTEHGWAVTLAASEPKTGDAEVRLVRGGETMTVWFIDGKADPTRVPEWTDGSRTVRLKNVSAVLLQASGERLSAKPATERRAPRRAPQGATVKDEDARGRLPFDPAGTPDEEIQEILRGRTIQWRNGLSKAIEEATLAAFRTVVHKAKVGSKMVDVEEQIPLRPRLETHPRTGKRIITFTDHEMQLTRSVDLTKIISVK